MLVPSIFTNSLFDDFFDFPYVDDKKAERKLYGHNAANLMKTDIQEYDDGYQLEIDLPGFKKDEVHAELKDGYLVVSAEKGLDEDEQDIFRRARNCKVQTSAKHAEMSEYRRASGFEAVLGYLYLTGNTQRLNEFLSACFEDNIKE